MRLHKTLDYFPLQYYNKKLSIWNSLSTWIPRPKTIYYTVTHIYIYNLHTVEKPHKLHIIILSTKINIYATYVKKTAFCVLVDDEETKIKYDFEYVRWCGLHSKFHRLCARSQHMENCAIYESHLLILVLQKNHSLIYKYICMCIVICMRHKTHTHIQIVGTYYLSLQNFRQLSVVLLYIVKYDVRRKQNFPELAAANDDDQNVWMKMFLCVGAKSIYLCVCVCVSLVLFAPLVFVLEC